MLRAPSRSIDAQFARREDLQARERAPYDPGGPVMSSPTIEQTCDGCSSEIEPGRYRTVGGAVYCDRCAPLRAVRALEEETFGRVAFSDLAREALDVLRIVAAEIGSSQWQRRAP
jgi:hypothetical protein